MHFEAAFQIVGDAGIKRAALAFQDVKKPVLTLHASGLFFFRLPNFEHAFVGRMHTSNFRHFRPEPLRKLPAKTQYQPVSSCRRQRPNDELAPNYFRREDRT